MSDVINLSDRSELEDLLVTEDKVVVKFTAPSWCRPCQQFAPVFKTVASQVKDTTFVAVDIDEADWATLDYGVQSVPTVVFFENGQRVRDLKERTPIKFFNELTD